MRCLGLTLFLFALAISGAIADSDLSSCLDPSTKLDAGGDVLPHDKPVRACNSPVWTREPGSGLTMLHQR